MSKRAWVPLGAIVLVLTPGLEILADEPSPLSLKDARSLALARNWDLLAARADVDLGEARRITARALPNPELSATVQKLQTGGGDGRSTRDTILAVTQLLEVGGKRRNRIRSAQAGLEAARDRFEQARARLDAGVVQAYVAALAAGENARIGRLSADSLARAADIASARYEAGEISEAEREQVAIAAGRFEADTRLAEAAIVQADTALQVLLGSPHPEAPISLADDLDSLGVSMSALTARALDEEGRERSAEGRGDVRAAAAAVEEAQAELRLQRALRIPDPALLAQSESEQPDNLHTVGFSVSLPVPFFYRNRGGIRAAEVTFDSARRELDRTRAQARAEIASSHAALEAALKRRALVHDGLLPRAEKVQQTVAFAYANGGASLLELLEAERNLNDLRLAALNTQAEVLRAGADLAAALGELLP